jgi:hypothetical protein
MNENKEKKIEIDEEIPDMNCEKIGKDTYINELKEKYEKMNKQNYENYSIKEINCLNNILENRFSVEKFKSYIDQDFLDNCEYKLIFAPNEFDMKEDDKFYFQGFAEKKKRKVAKIKNKNTNKNFDMLTAKKNNRKFD